MARIAPKVHILVTMKPIVILGAVFIIGAVRSAPPRSHAADEVMVIEGKRGRLHYVDLQQPVRRLPVDDADVTFHFLSRHTESTAFSVRTVRQGILTVDFNPGRRTAFLVHGWNNDKDSKINALLAPALLRADDWNVFVVDWREPANRDYATARGSVDGVGAVLSSFIDALAASAGLRLDKVTVVGHSLGAHVAGHAGRLLHGRLAEIVGLDAAMPLFSYMDLDARLDPSDAQHVQAIHTNGGFLGFRRPLGHADFYPNGGMNQNGCGLDLFGTCAHSRSYMYFEESLSRRFTATACVDKEAWEAGACDANEQVHMGGNFLNVRARGSYYLKTASKEPFAL